MSDKSSNHGKGGGLLLGLWEWRLDHPFLAILSSSVLSLLTFAANSYFIYDIHQSESGMDQYILNLIVLVMLFKELSRAVVVCMVIGGDDNPRKFAFVSSSPLVLVFWACSLDLMDAIDQFVDAGTDVALPVFVDLVAHDLPLLYLAIQTFLDGQREITDLYLLVSLIFSVFSIIRHTFAFLLAVNHRSFNINHLDAHHEIRSHYATSTRSVRTRSGRFGSFDAGSGESKGLPFGEHEGYDSDEDEQELVVMVEGEDMPLINGLTVGENNVLRRLENDARLKLREIDYLIEGYDKARSKFNLHVSELDHRVGLVEDRFASVEKGDEEEREELLKELFEVQELFAAVDGAEMKGMRDGKRRSTQQHDEVNPLRAF